MFFTKLLVVKTQAKSAPANRATIILMPTLSKSVVGKEHGGVSHR
jgi:hypothetical protein